MFSETFDTAFQNNNALMSVSRHMGLGENGIPGVIEQGGKGLTPPLSALCFSAPPAKAAGMATEVAEHMRSAAEAVRTLAALAARLDELANG